jgi:hypothetical protein
MENEKIWLSRLAALLTLLFIMAGCQTQNDVSPNTSQTGNSEGIPVEIKGKTVFVDRVVSGFLCDDNWSGTIYVGEVQVHEWEDTPTFLRDCSLNIEPGTVVYAAAHNGTRFLKGCSCHE